MGSAFDALVSELCQTCQCVICHQIVIDSRSCANGHLTCQDCFLRQAVAGDLHTYDGVSCAVCRDTGAWHQAMYPKTLLETIENHKGAPFLVCDNDCGATVAVADLTSHRRQCPYRVVNCPHAACGEELLVRDMIKHLFTHDEIVILQDGQPLTLLMKTFNSTRIFIVESEHGTAAFNMDFVGVFGRSGIFDVQQALVRVCCLTPGQTPWAITVQNRGFGPDCVVRETFHAQVPSAANVMQCKAIAHPTIMASSRSTDDGDAMYSGPDVAGWWCSEAMRGVRTSIRQNESSFVSMPRRSVISSALLLTLHLSPQTGAPP